jgi:hypothetical protein
MNDSFLSTKLHFTISKDIEHDDKDFQIATTIGDKPIHMTQNMAIQERKNYAYNKLWLLMHNKLWLINSQSVCKLVILKCSK